MSSDATDQAIGERLAKYARFGVNLGLDRIQNLLAALGYPHQQVPIVHVAGTNGKGSVCAYLSSVLTQAGYRVGRYTSPHLVSWCERICLNEQPIEPAALSRLLAQVEAAIASLNVAEPETPTQFEVFTAAAWLFFAQQAVDVAVIEVGLGGRLDATNVVDAPLATVITSLSREHWQRLGPTLADIAGEKAGILKSHCPAVVGPLPADAEAVVLARAAAVGCPVVRPLPAQVDAEGWAIYQDRSAQSTLQYRLSLAGGHQRINSAIAIAVLQTLRDQGWQISDRQIQVGLAQARWPGRLQWLNWTDPKGQSYPWLIDGAHNPAAATVLRQYIDELQRSGEAAGPLLKPTAMPDSIPPSTTWLMGMLSTKDHADVLRALLKPGDRLHLVPVPGHATISPADLRTIAISVCPRLDHCTTHETLAAGLQGAIAEDDCLRVLCGSLYLVGHFFQTQF
ncbi:MAG: bifunctional folylpolyglutamate synthase/dihydrofolate synthase [Leptolyngbyaceae cyanobacterium]